MSSQSETLTENGAVTLGDAQWQEARRRADVIRPLAEARSVSERATGNAGR